MLGKTFFKFFIRFVSLIVFTIFVAIFVYLLYKAVMDFNFQIAVDDLFPAMVGTFLLLFLSVGIALPFGVATGIYISFYAKGRFKYLLDISFEVLASMPSIVVGLFGFSILLFLHNFFESFRSSLLLSSISVSFLILPYMVKATQLGIQEVPKKYISIAYSLGATKMDIIFKILLPFAKDDILKGIFLSISRAAEDTAVIMLTGVVASFGIVQNIFSPFEALPFYIYYTSANYTDESELGSIFVASLLLILISGSFMFFVTKGSRVLDAQNRKF